MLNLHCSILSTDVTNFSPPGVTRARAHAPPRAGARRAESRDRCTAAGTARGTVGAGQYTAMRNLDRLRAPGPDSGHGTRMVVGTGRHHALRSSGLRSAARGSDGATTGAASASAIGDHRRTRTGAATPHELRRIGTITSMRHVPCLWCVTYVRTPPCGSELTKLTKPSSEATPALS